MSQQEADNLDNAALLTQQLNDAYVDAARRKAKPEQVQNADGSWPVTECKECDEDIPAGRLALGKIRCIHCQQDFEQRRGRW